MNDAFFEGRLARRRDEPADTNPYGKSSENWRRWAEGWKDQDEHETAAGQALNSIGWFG